jgi:ubiquinone biosynthesis protein
VTALLQALGRCLEVAAWSAAYGLRYAGRRLARPGADRATLRGEVLAGLLETLGPTFIKVGQILSTRPDVLPPETIVPLARLQDRVAPLDLPAISARLHEAFGRPADEVFAALAPVPLSTASIAQVHHARLHDGREVAVKVRRPGLRNRVRDDLRILRAGAWLLQRLPGLRLVPFEGFVREFGRAIERQLDFRLEAANNRRFQEHFRLMPQVRFPRLVDALCTDAVLTMEYVDGLTKVAHLGLGPGERREAARLGLKALYKMIFIDGFIHADMHPANLFFVRGPGLVLLDLGLVTELERHDLEAFVDFFLGLAENDGRACARVLYEEASYRPPRCDRAGFEAAMVALIDRHASLPARAFEVTRFAAELFATQRRYGLRGPTAFTMTLVALLVYEGMVKQLHPELDFQQEARLFILRARTRLIEQQAAAHRPPVPARPPAAGAA